MSTSHGARAPQMQTMLRGDGVTASPLDAANALQYGAK